MNIQINWKVAVVLGLVMVLAISVLRYESVANTFAASFAAILTALSGMAGVF